MCPRQYLVGDRTNGSPCPRGMLSRNPFQVACPGASRASTSQYLGCGTYSPRRISEQYRSDSPVASIMRSVGIPRSLGRMVRANSFGSGRACFPSHSRTSLFCRLTVAPRLRPTSPPCARSSGPHCVQVLVVSGVAPFSRSMRPPAPPCRCVQGGVARRGVLF